jgi:hypothetical protein
MKGEQGVMGIQGIPGEAGAQVRVKIIINIRHRLKYLITFFRDLLACLE